MNHGAAPPQIKPRPSTRNIGHPEIRTIPARKLRVDKLPKIQIVACTDQADEFYGLGLDAMRVNGWNGRHLLDRCSPLR